MTSGKICCGSVENGVSGTPFLSLFVLVQERRGRGCCLIAYGNWFFWATGPGRLGTKHPVTVTSPWEGWAGWVSAQSAVPCTLLPGSEHSLKSHLSHVGNSRLWSGTASCLCGRGRWSWGRVVFLAPRRRCGLEGHGAGASRKPFISGFEMGQLEPQGRAWGPWAALGRFPLCPGTDIHTCGWRGLPLGSWGLLRSSNVG